MPLYPAPNITNVTDIPIYINNNYCFDVSNQASCGYFGGVILFAILIILMVATKDRYPITTSFTFSSLITTILAFLMLPLSLSNNYIITIFSVFFLIGVFGLWMENR